MAKRNGLLLFFDWRESFAELSPSDCKSILMDMYAIAMDGAAPDAERYKGVAKTNARFLFASLKRGVAVSEKRSAAGKAGNRSRWGENSKEKNCDTDTDEKNVANVSQNDRKSVANVSQCDNQCESQKIAPRQDIRQDIRQDKTTLPPNPPQGGQGESARDELFERFWEKYPKKVKRAEAEEAWKAIAPDEALLECMLSAITTQKADEGWRREGGRYIPLPANWLRNRRWEDVPVVQTEPQAEQSGSFDTDDFFLAALKRTYGEEVPQWR